MAKNRLINLDELNAEDRKKVEEILAQQTKEKKAKERQKKLQSELDKSVARYLSTKDEFRAALKIGVELSKFGEEQGMRSKDPDGVINWWKAVYNNHQI